MYVYQDFRKDYGCYTVGFYDPKGNWIPEKDCDTSEEAAKRVHYLNGGREDVVRIKHEIHHTQDDSLSGFTAEGW